MPSPDLPLWIISIPHPTTEAESTAVKTPTKSRLLVIENVYHQAADGQLSTAFGDATKFCRDLDSDEQPYERRRMIKESWEPLDHGWIDRCGMLMIHNDEGKFSVNPTPEQREKMSRRVIEVSFGGDDPDVLVPPSEECRFYPADVVKIRLRCREGAAQCSLYLIPE